MSACSDKYFILTGQVDKLFSPVGQEFQNLAVIILIGITIGIIFDFYRVLRSFWRISRAGAMLMDMSFWFITSIIVIVGLIYSNYGELRFYVFLGLGAGLGIYYYFFSRFIIRLWYYLFYGITIAIGWLIRLTLFIVYTVRQLIMYILRPFMAVGVRVFGFFNKLSKVMHKKSNKIKNKILQKINIRKFWKDFWSRYRKKKKK